MTIENTNMMAGRYMQQYYLILQKLLEIFMCNFNIMAQEKMSATKTGLSSEKYVPTYNISMN